VLYVILTRWSYGAKELAWLKGHHGELAEKAKRVESQTIDPELEYEIELAHKEHKEFIRTSGT
jgi:HAE1 family hydrophobic/amphiphilic exporter-1